MANIVRVITLVLITYCFGDEAGQGFLHGSAGIVLMIVALLIFFPLDLILVRLRALRRKQGPPQIEGHEKSELIFALLAGAVLATGWLIERQSFGPGWLPAALYAVAYVFGGRFAVKEAIHSLRARRFEIDTLMLVAAAGAAALGEWAEGALLLFLFNLGHSLEHHAMDRARRAIEALAKLAPETARVRRGGGTEEIAVAKLQVADVVVVRPNERLPADGAVVAGTSVLGLVSVLLFAGLVVDEPFSASFYRAMAVLVAASPCALAISVPSAVLSGVARAARGGVLVKGGGPLENLGTLTSMAFDKTGTLTEGKPRLTDVSSAEGSSDEELLVVALAVEQHSDHPLPLRSWPALASALVRLSDPT